MLCEHSHGPARALAISSIRKLLVMGLLGLEGQGFLQSLVLFLHLPDGRIDLGLLPAQECLGTVFQSCPPSVESLGVSLVLLDKTAAHLINVTERLA